MPAWRIEQIIRVRHRHGLYHGIQTNKTVDVNNTNIDLDGNKIKFLHGLPYRPHSQGVVERLHRIIKKGLSSYKLKLKKNI